MADKKLQEVTIKRLTHNNPTMKAKFDEARQQKNITTEIDNTNVE